MAIYTLFELSIINDNQDLLGEYEKEIGEISGYGDLTFTKPIKWYEHNTHMIEFSKLHPTVVFELYGQGDKAGDLWKNYYKNGNVQTANAKITYDEYIDDSLIIPEPKKTPIAKRVNFEPVKEEYKEDVKVIVDNSNNVDYELKVIWWSNLSEMTKDTINRTLFFQKILDIEKAYDSLHSLVQ